MGGGRGVILYSGKRGRGVENRTCLCGDFELRPGARRNLAKESCFRDGVVGEGPRGPLSDSGSWMGVFGPLGDGGRVRV